MPKLPLVPGREIVGRVTAVGSEAQSFAVGEIASGYRGSARRAANARHAGIDGFGRKDG